MTRPLRNLISAVTLAALTGLLVLAATQWTDVFFRFYPAFSRWILGVLAGITSVTSFPIWEPGLCLIVLWGIISLIRSLVRHHFLRWLSGLLLTLCGAAFFFMAVWGLNYFAPPMSDRLGLETQERTPAELREVTAYFLQKAASGCRRPTRPRRWSSAMPTASLRPRTSLSSADRPGRAMRRSPKRRTASTAPRPGSRRC